MAIVLGIAWASASIALAITVVVFDRTTLLGVPRLWLGSLAFWSVAAFVWWTRPRVVHRRICLTSYEPVTLLWVTVPVTMLSLGLVAASYLSDQVHSYLFSTFYYGQVLSHRSWPMMSIAAVLFGYTAVWTGRGFLLRVGIGASPRAAFVSTLSALPALFPVATALVGLLLATAALSMINVNFWRYWATADGWSAIGHYPSTFTDALHVEKGGVVPYFISFPLLPAMLSASFKLVGHNTLGSYLPLLIGSVLLPLAVFLLIRAVTRNVLLAFQFSCLVATFPLLRNYTLDVAEADGLLMTTVVLAAYFRVKADGSSVTGWHAVAGLAAGVAALSRPEGALYMGAMYLAVLKGRWRDRGFWVSALVFGLVSACFSVVTLREFGMVWPGNHSGTISLTNFAKTLQVVRDSGVFSRYASALNLSDPELGLLSGVLLTFVVFGAIRIMRKDSALVYMPIAALGNIAMVFFVGPIPAEAAKYHDFFRHVSYGFPLLAVTMAYGINHICSSLRIEWLRVVVYLALAALVLAQISLLEGPVTPGRPAETPLMTSDVHVMASELLTDPYPLPIMEFRQSDSRYVPDAADYMSLFPDNVNRHYAGADVRLVGNALDYYLAAKMLFVWFAFLGFVSIVARRKLARAS